MTGTLSNHAVRNDAQRCTYTAAVMSDDRWNAHTIRELRVRLGRPGRPWTQARLAEAIGVTRRTVQNWEAGERPHRTSQLALDRLAAEADRVEKGEGEPTPEQLRALVSKALPFATDAQLTAEITRRFSLATPPHPTRYLPGPTHGRWVWTDDDEQGPAQDTRNSNTP